jgi:hypothetical protein
MTTHATREARLPRVRVPAVCIALASERAAFGPTCRTIATGAHYSIRGVASGSRYQVAARGMSCSVART